MTPSENRTDAAGADTLEKPGAPEEPAAEPSDAAEQVSANRSSTPDTSESGPPREDGEKPAGPSADDPAELRARLLRVVAEQRKFQRRLERERDDAVRFAATELVRELLQTA